MLHRLTIAAVAAATSLTLAGASQAADWRSEFDEIKFGILSGENEKDRIARYDGLKSYLTETLGVPVEVFTASAYDGVIQAMAGDQIEFAFHGSSSYAAAWTETEGQVIPLLTRRMQSGATGYFSKLYARCDSGIANIDDLKGKTLAFADPDSTSGYAVPYFNLIKQGIEPETYFGAIPFSGAHETGILGVVNGQYDAAVTWYTDESRSNVKRMAEKGMIEEGAVCDVWTSPEITNGPFTARANLPQDMIDEVVTAMMAFPEADPDSYAQIFGEEGKDLIAVDHEHYAWIIQMREDIRELRRKRGTGS